ncbi:MAG TPA: glycosyltransferase [Phycisphaerae bacterium]|nr:glycosyltransferase [Phycisphaerae bacterium]
MAVEPNADACESGVLVSVVVPVFNRERFIARCLRSVADQDGVDRSRIEIVVVDDGSTDGTASVVAGLDVRPARLVYLKIPHVGQPGTVRNHGLERASGQYIAYCDSDDVWLPHHLATALREFRKDPKLMMITTHMALARFEPREDGAIGTEYVVPPHPMHVATTNCRVHRHQCLERVAGFNTDRWGEDKAFFHRIEESFACRKLPIVTTVNGYIVGGNNITYEFDGGVRRAFFHGAAGARPARSRVRTFWEGSDLPDGRPRRFSGRKLAFALAAVVLFFLVRAPFCRAPLVYEEGIFADVFVNRPQGPDYHLAARIDGVNVYRPLSHPAPLYESMRLAGLAMRWLVPNPPLPDEVVTPRLRLAFSLFQLAIWLGVLALVVFGRTWSRHRLLLAMLVLVIASPIAIATSTQLQVDGSVGVLMNGLMALAILWAVRQDSPGPMSLGFLALGAFVVGLGKQEWTIVLLCTVACWLAYLAGLRIAGRRVGRHVLAAVVILVALAAGNALSYVIDPLNYRGGIAVMERVIPAYTVASRSGVSWLWVTGKRLPMLATPLMLMGVLAVMLAARRWRVGPYHVLLILYGLGLFGPFFVSKWQTDPRYFAPSVVALVIAVAAVFPQRIDIRAAAAVAVVLLGMAIHDATFVVRRIVRRPDPAPALVVPSDKSTVPRLPTGRAWNKPDVDFVGDGISRADAASLLEKYGKTLFVPQPQ